MFCKVISLLYLLVYIYSKKCKDINTYKPNNRTFEVFFNFILENSKNKKRML